MEKKNYLGKNLYENLTKNVSLPVPYEEQFGENQGWEGSYQCQILDTEPLDRKYLEALNDEELIKLARKMDNFLRERGISDSFIDNFSYVSHLFYKMDEREETDESYGY